jgi:hypothetical protein
MWRGYHHLTSRMLNLTLDVIAHAFNRENDFRTYYRHDDAPAGKSSVYMTSKLWDQMHWGERVSWRKLAVITVLQPGEVIPRMGDMRMMVERGYSNQLTMGAYHEMMQTTKLNQ